MLRADNRRILKTTSTVDYQTIQPDEPGWTDWFIIVRMYRQQLMLIGCCLQYF